MDHRIEILGELANTLAETLFDPKDKTAEGRATKRAEAHKAILAVIEALTAAAYASEAYVRLIEGGRGGEEDEDGLDTRTATTSHGLASASDVI